jgi:hypothetical protein
MDRELTGERVRKSDQVSRHRWRNEIRFTYESDFDAVPITWLRDAYDL